nr:reverse transcriptase domain-containing protein [Tanacetum cinerariifolium]
LEGDDKFPVIIAKDLSVEEKTALITVLKSHKRAIAWKLSDIKGWRVCIDYCKLNEATRKDHFPLPFMDQMLERLARNEYYCFLDGFSAYWALKNANFDLQIAGDHKKVQLNELNELRDQAYENSLIYKEKTKRLHDSKIKDRVFNIGDQVLLFNSRIKIFSGKLKTSWSGPFTITLVFPYGTIKLSQTDGPNFKVNGHRLKHYFGEDIPKMVVPDF